MPSEQTKTIIPTSTLLTIAINKAASPGLMNIKANCSGSLTWKDSFYIYMAVYFWHTSASTWYLMDPLRWIPNIYTSKKYVVWTHILQKRNVLHKVDIKAVISDSAYEEGISEFKFTSKECCRIWNLLLWGIYNSETHYKEADFVLL